MLTFLLFVIYGPIYNQTFYMISEFNDINVNVQKGYSNESHMIVLKIIDYKIY
jgi:hypothetical protein